MGIGVLLFAPDARRYEKSERLPGNGCNNAAELHALCALLEMAVAAGAKRLLVHGDSAVAIRYVSGAGATKIEPLLTLVISAQQWLERFDDVQLLWIPQHRNNQADRLSRLALGLPDRPVRVRKPKRRCR